MADNDSDLTLPSTKKGEREATESQTALVYNSATFPTLPAVLYDCHSMLPFHGNPNQTTTNTDKGRRTHVAWSRRKSRPG